MIVQLTPKPHPHLRNPRSRPRREPKAPQFVGTSRLSPSAPEAREPVGAQLPLADGLGVGARQALRDLLGCEQASFLGLSSEERRRCQDRMAVNRTGSLPLRFNLDPGGRYVENPEPYLNRRPTNGCKVRAAGDAGPMGQQGAAAGMTCARPF